MIMKFAGTALKNLFSKPATTQYPFVPAEYPERSRGHVEIDIDSCIMCTLCAKKCPPGAITVDRADNIWRINRFDCVQCGYCVDICKQDALKMAPGYQDPMDHKREDVYKKEVVQETKNPVLDESKCVYCTLCAKKCPEGALTVDRKARTWELNKEACVGCGLCAENCPRKAIEMK